MDRECYQEMELDAKVALIRELVPLGLMHVAEVLQEEVEALAGGRYERKDAEAPGVRYGSNDGSIRLAGQRVRVKVPRVRGERGEIPLRSYAALKSASGEADERLLKRVLYGLSCRNYQAAAESVPGAIGVSSSSVSRSFVEASAGKLREFQERDLSGEHYVAMFVDGKTFAESTMVVAMGVKISGEKEFLGFVETDTENAEVLTAFLRSLISRGLDVTLGILVVIDGSKGLRAAVTRAFKDRAVVGRCQWHKRENIVSYLPKKEQAAWRKRLQRAYNRPTFERSG
jgi:transposase-like protein